MHSTEVSRDVRAPRATVYRALLDARALEAWRVPADMTCVVEHLDPVEGGELRVVLTYDDPAAVGRTAGAHDAYRGRFARLVPDIEVVEVIRFETSDADLAAPMTLTTTLADLTGRVGWTRVTVRHEGVPDQVSAADNETGSRMALARLAALVETDPGARARGR